MRDNASRELQSELAQLAPGHHLCSVYESADEQLDTAIPFIRDGLRQGQRCVYIVDENSARDIQGALEDEGVDAAAEIARGALVLATKRDTYLRFPFFEPDRMIDFLIQSTEQALADGYSALRATGEMTWALGPERGIDRLIEYEAKLNDFFARYPAVAVCQYNLRRFPPEVIRDVLRTHPLAVIGHRVCNNLYYEPAESVLGPIDESRRVRWMLDQLTSGHESARQRRTIAEQLRQAQKMEAIGRLAGGVAHDFNNMLTVIASYSDLLLRRMPAADPLREDIEQIRAAGERAAQLTGQLLAFSRRQVLSPERVDINQVVGGIAKMAGRLVGEHIEIEVLLGTPLPPAQVDRGQLEQVIVNLVVNARDAMPRGGRLFIETELVDFGPDYLSTHVDATAGPHVMIAVSDTGEGMDRATMARLFEPFFTTKELGKGTGLGLSTAYGIIKQSGGDILAYSEPGRGSTFKVYLPAASGEAAADSEPVRSALQGGSETVLLVEDEELVRTLIATVLRRHGYQVLEAAGAGEALRLSDAHDGRIHLLLTDVVMPRVDGQALASRIQERRPDARVLYMSGYTASGVQHQGVPAGRNFLQKPVTPAALLSRVREILDAPAGPP